MTPKGIVYTANWVIDSDMESLIIWIITGVLVIAVVTPYYIKFRKRQKADLERRQEAVGLGLHKPRGQYPLIDMALCIGCGSCVEACPEEDVLGIVFGRATIINGQRCVGHGYCEQVCPVGALKVGLGDIKTRADIPITDENFQTNVTGIYIAGELGGLSLIKNAIEQGQTVMAHIANGSRRSRSNEIYDVIIIGAGPAGLSSSLSAKKQNLNYLTFDRQDPGGTILQYPRQKLVMTQPIEIPFYGWLKKEEYSKEFLLQIWQEIIRQNQLNIHSCEKVDKVVPSGETFEVITPNAAYRATNIVLAMGRRGAPRKLGVKGEDLSKTFYQLIDANSYQHKDLLIVGGGDSAVEAAIGLGRQKGNKVSISYRQTKFARVKKKNEERIHELINEKKVHPIFNSNLLEIKENTVVLKIGDDVTEIPNDYVFIFAGGEPPFKMLQEVGIVFGGEAKPVTPSVFP
jgi:thioredoxin reductase (NADPH)